MRSDRPTGATLACFAVLAFGACRSPAELALGGPRPVFELPPAELEGVVFEGYNGEVRDLRVEAERATVDLRERTARLAAVSIDFSEPTRGKVAIASRSAQLRLDRDDFVLEGGVTGSTQEGETFTTELVRFDQVKRQLVSQGAVKVEREGFELRAERLSIDVDSQHIRLLGKVEARLRKR